MPRMGRLSRLSTLTFVANSPLSVCQQRGFRGNRNCFVRGADFERRILAQRSLRLKVEVRVTESFEPLVLHGERVIARRQLGDREVTGGRGRAGVNLARGNVPHLDRRARNHRALRVGYDPRDGARRALPKCQHAGEQQNDP